MTTPASGGAVSDVILAAAKIAGVDRVFRVGGAQAVAALAYGTETIPQVDKICLLYTSAGLPGDNAGRA